MEREELWQWWSGFRAGLHPHWESPDVDTRFESLGYPAVKAAIMARDISSSADMACAMEWATEIERKEALIKEEEQRKFSRETLKAAKDSARNSMLAALIALATVTVTAVQSCDMRAQKDAETVTLPPASAKTAPPAGRNLPPPPPQR